jgi:pimeloyl-ACP methyl ester carboxylesterase
MTTFVVAHGAWSAGFAWKKMHPLLRATGHELVTMSYTGLGDRIHLANPTINLDTHIEDVVQVLFHEDLSDVALIAHSYGGMVATGVADRVPERIARLIYLDAFVPIDGQCALDLAGSEARARMEALAAADGDGWRVPSNPIPPDTAADDVDWIVPRRHLQPIGTLSQPLHLKRGETSLPRAYIYCTRTATGDMFGPFAVAAKASSGWSYHELDASHSPHVTAPEALARLLDEIVSARN